MGFNAHRRELRSDQRSALVVNVLNLHRSKDVCMSRENENEDPIIQIDYHRNTLKILRYMMIVDNDFTAATENMLSVK